MTLINRPSHYTNDPLHANRVRAARHSALNVNRHGAALIAFLFAAATSVALRAAAQQSSPPDPSTVSQAVQQYFVNLGGYQQGDLITRSQVSAALDRVREIGWDVPNRAAIAERALPDNSFLANQFSSSSGKKFMRRIANEPGAYARLDRLTSIGHGKAIVRDLMKQKDGDKFIEYLATTKSGQNLGHMLGGARQGVDLNKPTGRIYTAADLMNALDAEYEKSFR